MAKRVWVDERTTKEYEAFEAEQDSLINTHVPEQYRAGVKGLAWELGHSAGYAEVLLYTGDIVERIFMR